MPMAMPYFCTGVGRLYWQRMMFWKRESGMLSRVNSLIGSGTSPPLTSTGMLSYYG